MLVLPFEKKPADFRLDPRGRTAAIRRGLAWTLGLSLALGLVPGFAAAQESPPFGEVIDVEVVNVRVWVTSRNGEPVSGLTAEDFSVELDGEEVPITNFYEGGVESRAAERPGALQAVSRVKTTLPSLDAPTTVEANASSSQSRFIVYVDELHIGALDRKRVLKDLRQWFDESEIEPESILILQQAQDLRRLLPFGSSSREIDSVMRKLRSAPPGMERAPMNKTLATRSLWLQWREAQQLNDRNPCQFFALSAEAEVLTYAQQAAARARATLRNLEEVSSFLAGLEGFKALLYVGDILEVRPGEDLLELVRGLCPGSVNSVPADLASENISSVYNQVAKRANAGQVTFYTLQSSGLRVDSGYGADQISADVRVNGLFDRALRRSNRDGLEQLALQTGGEAIVNRNRFIKAFNEVAEDLETFYSLGVSPPATRAEGTLRLDVKVRGDRLRIRHRDSVELRSQRQRLFEHVMSAIHLGESQNPLGLRLASGTPQQDGDLVSVPLFVRVPADAVTFLPTPEGDIAELEVMVLARSPELPGSPPVTRTYRMPRPAAGSLLDLAMQLQLIPSGYVIGIGLQDRAAGTRSFVSTSIAVGAADGS